MPTIVGHAARTSKGRPLDLTLADHNSSGDSGVMSRFFGQMQTWLDDHTCNAFVVCTSNDISTPPAAFTRVERFNGPFYVGRRGSLAARSDHDTTCREPTHRVKHNRRCPHDTSVMWATPVRLGRKITSRFARTPHAPS
jgi:hypothetical protein